MASLSEYFLAGAERYTPEALRQAASESGFSPDEIDEAYGRATKRQRDEEMSGRIRRRARWIVLAAYGLVYAALVVAFLGYDNQYGAATISIVVLTVVLGVALLISIVGSAAGVRPPSSCKTGCSRCCRCRSCSSCPWPACASRPRDRSTVTQ